MLLIEAGGTSSFGSSTMFSLDSESEGIETSSVVSDVVSISGSDTETIGSVSMVLSISS